MTELKPFAAGDRVIYVPLHAAGDRNHPDCERGRISSMGGINNAFVKFDEYVRRFGWSGATSQTCHVSDLVHE